MPYPIDKKLVIAVASSALFDLSESHQIFKEKGVEEYKKYQEQNIDRTFEKGVAFPFIKRLLNLNNIFSEEQPVEVILLSRNSPETGLRAFRSIKKYDLNITRAAFFSGSSPYEYLPAFNTSLFLSADENDVRAACENGYAAGRVLDARMEDDESDELRIAFDFDGVIANDDAEKVYQSKGMEAFHLSEQNNATIPLKPGLLANLFARIAIFQKMESKKMMEDRNYKRILKTSIVTARNAPAHERLINTLKNWGVDVNEAFFLGGIDKARVLDVMHPHIFFDDQLGHLSHLKNIPAVHIPFGITNTQKIK
ncbi:5'-nucleotidase [Dysgonomonas hofstadii]|uniref:5'-nucleotidase n=1 Tax=Dysgonomonas hofstadii TaxID=637886 RepID=A0A840D1B8_9BACT|nr:5'-nucleotidase [Dysgonomonas hofstadii]MBB4038113.1 5'-nucleotidase [Dysgonomonas hofstadii]